MKKGHKKLLVISLILAVVLIFNSISQFFSLYTYALFLLGAFFVTSKLMGFEKDDFSQKKEITIVLIGGLLLYYTVTYFTVFFWGILQNRFVLSFNTFISTILPLFLIIILMELLRYVMITKGRRYTSVWIVAVIVFTLMDVTLRFRGYDFTENLQILRFLLEVVATSLAKNIFLCYLVGKVGFKPAIMFRLLFDLPLYLLPFFPNLGIFIDTVAKILLPNILLFILIFKYHNKEEDNGIVNRNAKVIARVSITMIILISTFMVALFSVRFTYYAIVVGSNSMRPHLNTGDVVIARRVDNIERLEEGQILLFKAENTTVIHRITRIEEVRGELLFFTKGDANDTEDYNPVREEDIVGTALFRFRYIGYPTVWLHGLVR